MNKSKKLDFSNLAEKPLTIADWFVFFIIAFFCFITFQQGDIFHTGGSSFAYLNGHIFDFYDYNVQYMGGNAYLPSSYILFAIWNIPVYLLRVVTIPTMAAPWIVIMWYKTLTTLFYLLSGFVIYKIGLNIGMESKKSKMMAYVFLTTPIGFFSQFIFGQYDIFTVFFVLIGIYYYFKGDLTKFAIYFGIALTFKYFAFLIFVPLLLLKEKKILKIIKYAAISLSFLILEILIYYHSPAFRSGVFGFGAKDYIFAAGFQTSHTSISIIIVLWMVTCAWAYFQEVEKREDFAKYALFFCNIVNFLIFGLSMWHPQWLLFGVPFMIMSSMISEKIDIFMLLDIILMLAFTIFTVNFWINHVDQALMHHGIFKNFLTEKLGENVSMRSLFKINDQKMMFSIISGIFLVNAVFKHPKFCVHDFNKDVDKHWNLIRARFIIGVSIFVVPALICAVVSVL